MAISNFSIEGPFLLAPRMENVDPPNQSIWNAFGQRMDVKAGDMVRIYSKGFGGRWSSQTLMATGNFEISVPGYMEKVKISPDLFVTTYNNSIKKNTRKAMVPISLMISALAAALVYCAMEAGFGIAAMMALGAACAMAAQMSVVGVVQDEVIRRIHEDAKWNVIDNVIDDGDS